MTSEQGLSESGDAPTPPCAPEPTQAPQAAAPGPWPSQTQLPESRRLPLALLISLLFHALLLSLILGGEGLGLPQLSLPWQDRRVEAPDLSVVLLSAQVSPEKPSTEAQVKPPGTAESTMLTVLPAALPLTTLAPAPAPPPLPPSPPASPAPLKAAAAAPQANPTPVDRSNPDVAAPIAPVTPVTPVVPVVPIVSAVAVTHPLPTEPPIESVPAPAPTEDVIALTQSDVPTWTVPAKPSVSAAAPAPALRTAPEASSPQPVTPQISEPDKAEQDRAQQQAKLDQARKDAQRKAEQLQAERQEAARLAAARQAAALQESARVEAARLAAQRQEAAKQAMARQEAARQESARVEAMRVEAERQEAANQATKQAADRQESARQEAARQESARADAARQEAQRQEAAKLAAQKAEAEKREERLRAIGRQLNEEADRRDAALAAQRLQPAWSSARRGRLFGHTDASAELIAYAQAWSRKIQLNMTFDLVREAARQPHTDPMVTVAIRSDGSVESITFVRSSGVAALDEAVRRVVQSQANYPAFPLGLSSEYDVIEIRRTWHFDTAIRMQ